MVEVGEIFGKMVRGLRKWKGSKHGGKWYGFIESGKGENIGETFKTLKK